MLALFWAVTKEFSSNLVGPKFAHVNPLSHLDSAKLGAMEQRWVAALVLFEYKIKHQSGQLNAAADALTRWPGDVSTPVDNDESCGIDCVSHTTPIRGKVGASVHKVDTPNFVGGEAISSFPRYTKADLRKLQEIDPEIQRLLEFWPGPKPRN